MAKEEESRAKVEEVKQGELTVAAECFLHCDVERIWNATRQPSQLEFGI